MKKVSEGSNSECYMVKDEKKKYCMKVITVDQKDEMKKKEIEKEIKILGMLKNHPYMVEISRSYCKRLKDKTQYFLVLEWAEMNLDQYLGTTKKGCLGEFECKKIFKQILNAVNFCHLKMITHQDLKLENVCINPNTKKIKIVDFGFATISDSEMDIKAIDVYKGSPIYSPPGIKKKTIFFFCSVLNFFHKRKIFLWKV